MTFRTGNIVEFGMFTTGYDPVEQDYFSIGQEEIGLIVECCVSRQSCLDSKYESFVLIGERLAYVRNIDMKVIA